AMNCYYQLGQSYETLSALGGYRQDAEKRKELVKQAIEAYEGAVKLAGETYANSRAALAAKVRAKELADGLDLVAISAAAPPAPALPSILPQPSIPGGALAPTMPGVPGGEPAFPGLPGGASKPAEPWKPSDLRPGTPALPGTPGPAPSGGGLPTDKPAGP